MAIFPRLLLDESAAEPKSLAKSRAELAATSGRARGNFGQSSRQLRAELAATSTAEPVPRPCPIRAFKFVVDAWGMLKGTSLGRGLWRLVATRPPASLPAPSFGCDARGGGRLALGKGARSLAPLPRARVVFRSSYLVRVCGCLGSLRHGRGWLRSPLHSRPASRHVPPFGRANPPSRGAHRSQRSRLISWLYYGRLTRP